MNKRFDLFLRYLPLLPDDNSNSLRNFLRAFLNAISIPNLKHLNSDSYPLNNEQISRIVGLPSEKIQIKKGEIFIDSQFLDTFYGKAHRAGLEMKEYMKAMEEEDAEYHADSVEEIFEMDLEEMKLKSDEYFLISDDWLRGDMVRIDENQITGIILGYEK